MPAGSLTAQPERWAHEVKGRAPISPSGERGASTLYPLTVCYTGKAR